MDISFESFATLIYRLGHPPKSKRSQSSIPPCKIFQSWLNHLQRPLIPQTGKHLFRLLFPHEGSRRRYGLKEAKLAVELERILAVYGLRVWDGVGVGMGCLGLEVQRVMRDRVPEQVTSGISIREVNVLLDALASHSPFSQLSQPPRSALAQGQILQILFRDSHLSPNALCLLTQIILRDLRPLLNPLPHLRISNPTAMLRLKSNTGPKQLELGGAMRCWDARMVSMYYGGKGDLDWCLDAVEKPPGYASTPRKALAGPVVGVNVQIPKCRKGRSVEDALNAFTGSSSAPPPSEIWAETKYDGYRMQIHVEVRAGHEPKITIFSKSKRESTADRINTHAIIIASLGLPIAADLPRHLALDQRVGAQSAPQSRLISSVILEAEVVPYNEGERQGGHGPGIEEFWWLGAAGVSPDIAFGSTKRFDADRHRHLCLVFFDILYVDGRNLLSEGYDSRRKLLEENIRPIDGFSMLAERTRIPLHLGRPFALESLRHAFAISNNRREEGLILKAARSTYTRMTWPWVKLKKDYIPNLGDCIDLVILGAGWDLDRARELRVDTSVYTTFYIGTLTNADRVRSRTETPHFEILFRASYGPSRDELEMYNEKIRHGRWASKPYDRDDPFKRRLLGLSWTYHMPKGMNPPSVLFETPLCAEVMGAGFQKLPFSKLYELRFARLLKIHNPIERSWIHALDSTQLLSAAHQALRYIDPDRGGVPPSPEDDSVGAAWRSSSTICLDIPELPTPTPSPEKKGAGRFRSAPEIIKVSPPTPRREYTGVWASNRVARSLFTGLGYGVSKDGTAEMGQTSPRNESSGVAFSSRPYGRKRRRMEEEEHYDSLGRFNAYQLQTPPPSSPADEARHMISPPFDTTLPTPVVQTRRVPAPSATSRKRDELVIGLLTPTRRLKALSLRSRIKLAVKGSIVGVMDA